MRTKLLKIALTTTLAFALALTLSCSPTGDDDEQNPSSASVGEELRYAFCVFTEYQQCLTGNFTACDNGGLLSNACPRRRRIFQQQSE